MAVHAANLGAEAFDGAHQSFSEGRAADQKPSVAAELKGDEMKVDGGLGGIARSLRPAAAVVLGDRNAASFRAAAANVGIYEIEQCRRRLPFVATNCILLKCLVLGACGED